MVRTKRMNIPWGYKRLTGTYHDIRVDVFDDELAYVVDSNVGLAVLLHQHFGLRLGRRICLDGGEKSRIGIVYVVGIPGIPL